MDRPNGGLGRGYSQDIRTEIPQATTAQPERQEENWSVPANIERRENETERCEITQPPPLNVLPPADDRLFTDWSSTDSPRERVSQCNQSARSVEPNITQPVNQTEQPVVDPAGNEVMGNTLRDVATIPSTRQQLNQLIHLK